MRYSARRKISVIFFVLVSVFISCKKNTPFTSDVIFTVTTGTIQIGPAPLGTVFNSGQDAWEFYCPAGITINITVNVVELWAEIGLFAPGTTTYDTNLLTGSKDGLASGGVNQSITTSYGSLATAGNYIIAIEDQGDSPETSGSYEIIISSSQQIGPITQIIDQGPETLPHENDG